jgi:hypothetical protein
MVADNAHTTTVNVGPRIYIMEVAVIVVFTCATGLAQLHPSNVQAQLSFSKRHSHCFAAVHKD